MTRRWVRPVFATLLALACAKMGPPPGGPPDVAAPRVVSRRPDSIRVIPDFRGDVEFRFNEVISEGSSPNFGLGTGTLEALILLSPSRQVPLVRWRRDRIVVRPREGWVAGRVYRVELLPGLNDLRNNPMDSGSVVTFTTGAPLPVLTLRGRVVDWTSRRPQPGAVLEAVLLPDSLSYRIITDSLGQFELGPLPAGEYLVYGGLDQNRNLRLEAREPFDTLRMGTAADSVGDFWAFRHDSAGPRIQTVTERDSVSIAVTFTQSLDPRQVFDPAQVRVLRLPDSIPVRIRGVYPASVYDSLFRVQPPPPATRADSLRADSVRIMAARRDSVAADSLARQRARELEQAAEDARRGIVRRSTAEQRQRQLEVITDRPALFDRLVIRLDTVLVPGGRYAVGTTAIVNPNGASTTSLLVLVVPERPAVRPEPPDSAVAPPDTLAIRRPPIRPPARGRPTR